MPDITKAAVELSKIGDDLFALERRLQRVYTQLPRGLQNKIDAISDKDWQDMQAAGKKLRGLAETLLG